MRCSITMSSSRNLSLSRRGFLPTGTRLAVVAIAALLVSPFDCLAGGEPVVPEQKTERQGKYASAEEQLKRARRVREAEKAAAVLVKGLPATRDQLTSAARRASLAGRTVALRILGEQAASIDVGSDVLVEGLKDSHRRVRLAAIMALRAMGPKEHKSLARHLPRETVPNNRKMIVKTFQRWGDDRAVDAILQLLEDERHTGVQEFCFRALRVLTRRDFGRDVRAWNEHWRAVKIREELQEARAGDGDGATAKEARGDNE